MKNIVPDKIKIESDLKIIIFVDQKLKTKEEYFLNQNREITRKLYCCGKKKGKGEIQLALTTILPFKNILDYQNFCESVYILLIKKFLCTLVTWICVTNFRIKIQLLFKI